MIEKIIYENHQKERIVFGEAGLFVNENALRDFTWNITSKNDRISSFSKKITKISLPVVILDDVALANRIFEVMEKDVLAEQYGRFYIGDYYLQCYCTGSKKKDYLKKKGMLNLTLDFQTDKPMWFKETEFVYPIVGTMDAGFLDYPHDYPYDFCAQVDTKEVNNSNFVASDFVMRIFGYVQNPTVYIAGHAYTVNVAVDTGEYLTIDSSNKTIVLTKQDGTKVNCFNARNKESYVFKKIDTGSSILTLSTPFLLSITLLAERGEPLWT